MSAFLTLDNLSATTPDHRPLFDHLTLSLGAERVGLVGRNGSGKSTLLRIVAGQQPPASGSMLVNGRIGTLAQSWPDHMPVADALGVAEPLAILARIVAGEGSEADFDGADWTLEERITAALAKTGLPDLSLDRAMGTLSGGERMRVGLAGLAIAAPDILLLDEPTNDLDAEGRAAVMALLADWRGGVLVASHDRALLEAMDRIVELTPFGVSVFGGNWSAFAEAREDARDRAATALERSEADARQAKRAMQQALEGKARRDKAGRAFAAKKSEPKILLGRQAERAENSGARGRGIAERLVTEADAAADAARARVEVLTPLTIDLPPSGIPANADLLDLDAVCVRRGDRVFGPWTLHLRGPERVALSGANGAGKTTLLRLAHGDLVPYSGRISHATGRVAMLDQHVSLLDDDTSILDNFRRINSGMDDNTAHAALARFAFRNRDALQLAGSLSGGERLRAGLACTLTGERPPWLLLLDEPTNHLDIDSIEVLEAALREYDGALLVISHDAAFLDAIAVQRVFAV